jgi:hypothetical protein
VIGASISRYSSSDDIGNDAPVLQTLLNNACGRKHLQVSKANPRMINNAYECKDPICASNSCVQRDEMEVEVYAFAGSKHHSRVLNERVVYVREKRAHRSSAP